MILSHSEAVTIYLNLFYYYIFIIYFIIYFFIIIYLLFILLLLCIYYLFYYYYLFHVSIKFWFHCVQKKIIQSTYCIVILSHLVTRRSIAQLLGEKWIPQIHQSVENCQLKFVSILFTFSLVGSINTECWKLSVEIWLHSFHIFVGSNTDVKPSNIERSSLLQASS